MKKEYTDPTFELVRLTLTNQLLTASIDDFKIEDPIREDVHDDD